MTTSSALFLEVYRQSTHLNQLYISKIYSVSYLLINSNQYYKKLFQTISINLFWLNASKIKKY